LGVFGQKKATSMEKILTPTVLIQTFYHRHHFYRVLFSNEIISLFLHEEQFLEHPVKIGIVQNYDGVSYHTPVVATFHYRLSGNQK
jgi:hypothetical protein